MPCIFVKNIFSNSILLLLIFTNSIFAESPSKGRTLDVVIYPVDPTYMAIGNYVETKLKEVFVDSKRFNVVNENKQNEQIFLLRKRLLLEGSCRKNECFDKIKKLILADIIIRIKVTVIDSVYIIEILAIDKHNNYKIIATPHVLRYKKLGKLLDAIQEDTKKVAKSLKDEIWYSIHKPDWVIDLELSVSAAYVINTGRLRNFIQNGYGGLIELKAFGLYQNMFLKTQLSYFMFSGINYSEEKAYFITTDVGIGYMVNIPHTNIAFSPAIGIGGFMSILKSKKHDDLSKRGILEDENKIVITKAFCTTMGFKVSYQYKKVKFFTGIYDNIYFTKDIYNQVVTSVGALYVL